MTGRYPSGKPLSPWEEVRAEIEAEGRSKNAKPGHEAKPHEHDQDSPAHEEEGLGESEVVGELPPLVPEGSRIMVCIDYQVRQTRHGLKDYLFWREEETGLVLPQYFRHYDKYPVGSKAVRNFLAALGERPKRLDRIGLRKLVGLRARVFVETVRPNYSSGALKGKSMPESLSYSKVSEIQKPLGRIDLTALN